VNAYVTAPFITTISSASSASDVTGPHDFGHAVLDLYRRAHYKDADQPAILAELRKLLDGARLPTFASIFLSVSGAVMSDRWTNV
jgi:hypothetical protein